MTLRRRLVGLVIVAGLVIAAAVVWPPLADRFRAQALDRSAATLPSRPFAGRLHDLPYVPRRAQRGENDRINLRLKAEASRVLQGSAAPALRGKALLLIGNATEAAQELEHAAEGGNASALSDLAAARVQEADQSNRVEPALAGVIAARRALHVSPNLAAAHFNIALALERIGLTNEAAGAFGQAAALEPGSAWAAEALSRAHAIREAVSVTTSWTAAERRLKDTHNLQEQKAIVASNVPAARRAAEGSYLIDWAVARVEGRHEDALAALTLARLVSTALRDVTGDRLAWDAVSAIDRAESAGGDKAVSLARAHLMYRDGRVARRDHDDARAIPLLEKAAGEFAAAGSPLQYVARYHIIGADYELGRIDDALARLSLLDGTKLRAQGYGMLVAQLGWAHGICLLVRGAYGEAFDMFDEGYRLATTFRDDDLAATLDGLAAQALEYLGDHEEAWTRRARALRLNALVHNDTRRAVTLASAANSQLAARNWPAASALLDYALPLAEAAHDPLVTGQILAERSIARDESEDHVSAARDRAAASRAARQVAALGRNRLLGFVDIAEGIAQRTASPIAAITYFSRTIDQQRQSAQSSLLPRLYYERARARAARGDLAGEKDDLRAGLDVVKGWEKSIATPEQRATVTVWSDAMRRDLIASELADGDVASAFADSDTRPEPLISATQEPSGVPLDALRRVREALAPDAAVVELVRVREKFVVFVVRHDVALAVTLPSSASRIAVAARALRTATDNLFAPAAADLYTLIFEPIRRHLDGVHTLAFVPDHDLTGLSLGGLLDPNRNRYLGEDFVVVHAPTASAAIRLSREARDRTGNSVVAIGASEFDHAKHPDLEELPNVGGEVKAIAEVWRPALLLIGAQVTQENIRREVPQAGIVHFAGHIIGHGANSRLVIGGDDLAARDIAHMHLDVTRAVILAACRGAASHDSPVMYADVGGAFLAAGAPVVVATSNDVDDAEVPRVMVRLHTFLRDGDDAAAALRKTIMFERSAGRPLPLSLRFLATGGTSSLIR